MHPPADSPRPAEIQLLLDCLCTPASAPARLRDYSAQDWQGATEISRRQGVLPLFAARAQQRYPQAIPPDTAAYFLESSRTHALRSLRQTAEVQQALSALL